MIMRTLKPVLLMVDYHIVYCENWTDQIDTNMGQRKKSEFPTGIEPMTYWTPGGALSTELQELMES